MEFATALLIFTTGLGFISGSFLNVLVLRYNTGRSLYGRSACFSCTSVLAWYELVPVGSYVVQLGRCRHCDARISPQYPLVELLTGILFGLLHLKLFPGVLSFSYVSSFLLYGTLMSLLVAILVYDIRHKIIPNGLVYLAAFLSLALLFVDLTTVHVLVPETLALLAGPLVALPFALLWLVSGGRWMGLGDGKLALVIGWLLGLTQGITAVLLAFWSGALVSLLMLALSRLEKGTSWLPRTRSLLTMKSEVPFAPFLIVSLWFVFFSHFDLVKYILW